MQKFIASESLAQVFLLNGYKDVTEERYPEHYKRMLASGYNPQQMKRAFSSSPSTYVLFDYNMIMACYKGSCNGFNMKTELSKDELTSVIAFSKLPVQTRSAIKRNGTAIPELYKDYYAILEHPNFYKDQRSQIIVKAFESVILR